MNTPTAVLGIAALEDNLAANLLHTTGATSHQCSSSMSAYKDLMTARATRLASDRDVTPPASRCNLSGAHGPVHGAESLLSKFLLVLNSAFYADPAAIHALVCNQVPCNEALADHPSIVVDNNLVVVGTHSVGLLGIVNGIVEAATGKRVAVAWTAEADEDGRRRMFGFVAYTPNPKGE